MAKLYFRYAVMNAGKSTQLLQIAHDYEANNGLRALVLKPAMDTKEGPYVISRLENGQIRRQSDFLIDTAEEEGWLYERIAQELQRNPAAIVLIDEAQFLGRANVWDLCRVVTYLDLPVICFGLKVDAFGNPFEGSSVLFALAQDIEEVTTRAICQLTPNRARKATIHLRLVDGQPVFTGEQVAIDNRTEIRYLPVCLQEYIRLRDARAAMEPQAPPRNGTLDKSRQ